MVMDQKGSVGAGSRCGRGHTATRADVGPH